MKKNYSLKPYKIFNTDELQPVYEKLNMLKDALDLSEDKEVNEDLIFNLVSEHNYKEFYLLEYVLNKTIYAPKEIKAQNFLLTLLYSWPREYKKQYEIIKEAYKNNDIFKKFANSLREDLCLEDKHNCKLFNYQVYEICSKYITNKSVLEPVDVHLNLHFIQKWIFEQNVLKLDSFTDVEKDVLYYLANGYSVCELVGKNLIKGEKDKSLINTIIHEILPAKCNVETINQVMAIYFCCYPNIARMQPLISREMKCL